MRMLKILNEGWKELLIDIFMMMEDLSLNLGEHVNVNHLWQDDDDDDGRFMPRLLSLPSFPKFFFFGKDWLLKSLAKGDFLDLLY